MTTNEYLQKIIRQDFDASKECIETLTEKVYHASIILGSDNEIVQEMKSDLQFEKTKLNF
jgi:hypothetical protein